MANTIKIINNILLGCEHVLPTLGSETNQLNFNLYIGVDEKFTMPDGGSVRQYVIDLMTKVQTTILKNTEGDTTSLTSVMTVSKIFITKKNVPVFNCFFFVLNRLGSCC